MFYRVERTFERIAEVLLYLGALAITVMMLNISVDVMSRGILGEALPGTVELVSSWYMVGFAFLPLAHIQASRAQVKVELFTQNMAERWVAGFDAVAMLLSALYLAALSWTATEQALRYTRIGETWDAMFFEIHVWPTRWFIPAGCGIAAVIAALQLVDDVRLMSTGRRARDAWDHIDESGLNV